MPDQTELLNYEILDLLTSLAEKSLVIYENVGERVRFRLLETVREYGRDRLVESGDMPDQRKRHLIYYARLVEEIEPGLQGPDQIEVLNTLELEHDNLRSALNWSLTDDECVVYGLRIAGALGWFWKVRGFFAEGLARCQELLELPGASTRDLVRAKALNAGGSLAETLGEVETAYAMLTEALDIRNELNDLVGVSSTLNNLAVLDARRSDYDSALTRHAQSLEIDRKLGNKRGIANTLTNMANVEADKGNYPAAKAHYEESLALKRKLSDTRGIANTLSNLAVLAQEQGDGTTARELQEEAHQLRVAIGDRYGIATSLINLGRIAKNELRFEDARLLFEESLTLRRELGGKQSIATALGNLGQIARLQGDLATALTLQKEALETRFDLGNRRNAAESLEEIAQICFLSMRNRDAVLLLAAADAMRDSIEAPIPPQDRPQIANVVDLLRDASGPDFDALWAEGAALPWADAVALALSLTA